MNRAFIGIVVALALLGLAYGLKSTAARVELATDETQGGGGGSCFLERINQVASFNITGYHFSGPISGTFVYPLDQPYGEAAIATHFFDMTITGTGRTIITINGVDCADLYQFNPGELPQPCFDLLQPGRNTFRLQWVSGTGATYWYVEKLYLGINVQPANC